MTFLPRAAFDGQVCPHGTIGDVNADRNTGDPAIDELGIELSNVSSGTATASVVVQPSMANSHGVCHGGILFQLADTVMDYATNAGLEDGTVAFASHAEIDFVRAAMVADTLTATGGVKQTWGRTSLVDVTITNQDGHIIAHFRGRTRRVGGNGVGGDGKAKKQ